MRASVGFCLGAAMPTANARVGLLRTEHRASAYSLMVSATSLGVAAGPLRGGALGTLYGLRPVFLITASVPIRVALVVATTVREAALEPADRCTAKTQRHGERASSLSVALRSRSRALA